MARSAAVLIDGSRVALIERERQGKIYYLFPGGTVEQGETLEEACIREIQEELGLFGTGDGEEYHGDLPPERGTYKPIWMAADQLLCNPVHPKCVCELIPDIWAHKSTGVKRFRDYGNGVCEPVADEE